MEKIKVLLTKALAFLKDRFTLAKVLSFFKKWGLHIVNLLVLCGVYNFLDAHFFVYLVVALWILFLFGYYIFWKLFGAEKAFKKNGEK